MMKLHQLSLLLLSVVYGDEREYHFEAYVSAMFSSGTVDEIFFRLCNDDDECSLFTEVPAGWQSTGTSYKYTVSTKEDLGDIYKVEIVHPGSDTLCIGHIMVEGVEYDENEHRWIDWPHCIEETNGGGCDTVTIILPTNKWNSALTVPCEHDDDLHATYAPTGAPSTEPTEYPTPLPTPMPTSFPSNDPTTAPSMEPTMEPTTGSPTVFISPQSVTSESNGDGNLAQISESAEMGQSKTHRLMVFGAVIGAAVTFLLCLCLTIFLASYCWGKRRKMENGMQAMQCSTHDPDDKDHVVMMEMKSPNPIMTEGAGTARKGTTDTGSGRSGGSGRGSYDEIGATPVSAAYDEGDDAVVVVVEEEEVDEDNVDAALLEADDGSSDEGLFTAQNAGTTDRRETLDLSRSLDEDILPKEDEDEDGQKSLEWHE